MRAYERCLNGAVDINDVALQAVFGVPAQAGALTAACEWFGFGSEDDVYDGLGSLWRHCAKDWSAEGAAGGEALRTRILEITAAECTRWPAEELPVRVLVPGCGQARLAWALADALPQAHVSGLERSEATLSFARHVLRDEGMPRESLHFHPWLDAFPNNYDVASRCAAVAVPDLDAPSMPPNLALHLADFLDPASAVTPAPAPAPAAAPAAAPDAPGWQPRPQHVVCTHFFLDCVDDLVGGCTAVRDALVPGGAWIFSGPLHYHQGGAYMPRPSPALSHVLELAADLGFEVEAEPALVPSPYLRRPQALVHEADWTAALFVARRRADYR